MRISCVSFCLLSNYVSVVVFVLCLLLRNNKSNAFDQLEFSNMTEKSLKSTCKTEKEYKGLSLHSLRIVAFSKTNWERSVIYDSKYTPSNITNIRKFIR